MQLGNIIVEQGNVYKVIEGNEERNFLEQKHLEYIRTCNMLILSLLIHEESLLLLLPKAGFKSAW